MKGNSLKGEVAEKLVLTFYKLPQTVYRYWTANNMNEWHEYWWCEDYDGPAGDDEVVELFVNGKKVPDMKTFEDIVSKYKFDLPYPT